MIRLVGALLLVWTVYVTFLVANDPDRGAPDRDSLCAQFTAAVAQRNDDKVRLLVAGQPSDSNIQDLMQPGTTCDRVQIKEHNGRWFIEPE